MITILVSAPLALFARPEFQYDKYSYDIITPTAARGVMECIYWHPGLRWVIDRIYILNPIQFADISNITSNYHLLALCNVSYVIQAHFKMTQNAAPTDNVGKFTDIIRRRLKKGPLYKEPYLGSKEYPAKIEFFKGTPDTSAFQGIKDLGVMLFDYDYTVPNNPIPLYFRAILKEGVLDLTKKITTFK